MPPVRPRAAYQNILPGLLITVLGVLLILHNFGVFNLWQLRRLWPLLLIAFGLSKVFETRRDSRVLGVVLIVVGGALQLSNLGWLHLSLRGLLKYWPLLLVGLGLRLLILYRRPGNLTGGLLLLSLGVILQLESLDLLPFAVWRLWPVLIIIIGVGMVQKALGPRARLGS